jgi:hypothetical protein
MILRRLEGSRFSEVVPLWGGLTVVIFAAGSSLTLEQAGYVGAVRAQSRCRCIAVNDTYLVAPWADVVYFADSHWWKWHTEGIAKPILGLTADQVREKFAAFAGQKCTLETSGGNVTDEAVHMMRIAGEKGLSLDPQRLVTGRNSGFQALNLAILAGAKRIVLLGFDGQQNPAGRDHFHGGHPRPTPAAAYPLYRQAMSFAENAILDAGVEVLNCSPGSVYNNFPKVKLEDVL